MGKEQHSPVRAMHMLQGVSRAMHRLHGHRTCSYLDDSRCTRPCVRAMHVLQGRSQSHAQASGAPILQLTWNQPQRSDDKLLLACRTSHWICMYEASPFEAQQAAQSGPSSGRQAVMDHTASQ